MKAKHVFWGLGVAVALFAAAEAGIFFFHRELTIREQRNTGRLLVDRIMLSAHFQAMAREDDPTDQGFLKFVQMLTEDLATQKCAVRFISPDPTFEKEQPSDDFVRDLLARFAGAPAEERAKMEGPQFAERGTADGTEYRYYQPIYAEKKCLGTCHQPGFKGSEAKPEASPFGRGAPGDQKWKEGELMAVVEITIPSRLHAAPIP